MDWRWWDKNPSLPETGGPQKNVLRSLTYSSFPWNTHPIDTRVEQQGWGPFNGPWQTVDFADPAASIDLGYTGSNKTNYAPGYAGITVFKDPSESLVANHGFLTTLESALGLGRGGTSTIGQTVAPSSSQPSPFSKVLTALGVTRG